MKQKVDRRTIRSELVRRKIVETAKDIFVTNGYKKTTVTRISKAANVGYGTVYNHFPNGKDELFLTIIEDVMKEFYSIADNEYTVNSKAEAHQFILQNIEGLMELAIKHQSILNVFHESIWLSVLIHEKWEDISQRFIQRVGQNVEQAILKNLARNPAFSPEIVASVLFYTTEKNIWNIVLNKTDKDYHLIAKNIAEIYTNGLYK